MSTDTTTQTTGSPQGAPTSSDPGVTPGTEPVADPAAAPVAAASPEPAKEPAEDPRLTKAFGALARKDRDLRAREQALKSADAELNEWRAFQAQIKSNPRVLLDLAQGQGIDMTALLDAASTGGGEPTVEDKLKQLEEWKAETERRAEEAKASEASAKQEADIQTVISQIAALAQSEGNAEKFELVNAAGAHDDVWGVILGYHQKYGTVLPYETALEVVEKELEERESARVESLLKTKKFSARFAPPAPALAAGAVAASNTPTGARASGPTTLTNANVSEVPANAGSAWPRDIEESRKRAAQLIRFT